MHGQPHIRYCHSLQSPYSIPQPCTRFQTPFHKTSTYSNMQSHQRVSPTFPLLAHDSTLSLHDKLTIYKLLIRPILTYAAPIWSNISPSNYRHLQVLQSKCRRVIGDYPRRTLIPHLHSTLSLEPIHEFIYCLTAKFFHNCSTHPNPLVCQIGNYTLLDLHVQYRKYMH